MNNLTQPAYPVVPLQDNFQRLIVPIPGISKIEHFALEIYKAKIMNNLEEFDIVLMDVSIEQAITFLEKLEEKIKNLNNDKSNQMAIFDR
jgi:GTPase Era involved in 16S rRNA processing